jgi:hypothetical protein
LKAPGFNPRAYKVKTRFQSLLFQILNLYRYGLGRLGETLETAEWWWKCRLQPAVLRVTAVTLGGFSCLTIWAESTVWWGPCTSWIKFTPSSL